MRKPLPALMLLLESPSVDFLTAAVWLAALTSLCRPSLCRPPELDIAGDIKLGRDMVAIGRRGRGKPATTADAPPGVR
jgi:hypothetical protein